MSNNAQQPAFPLYAKGEDQKPDDILNIGLSKRELLSGIALHSLLANTKPWSLEEYAKTAVRVTDILLAELEKQQP